MNDTKEDSKNIKIKVFQRIKANNERYGTDYKIGVLRLRNHNEKIIEQSIELLKLYLTLTVEVESDVD